MMLETVLDGDISSLHRRLRWMPSHVSEASMRTSPPLDSRHREVTWSMWRANRLADGLAKSAARQERVDQDLLRRLGAWRDMHLHVASVLGWVTHAANHCRVTQPDGQVATLRDAEGKRPARRQRRSSQQPGTAGSSGRAADAAVGEARRRPPSPTTTRKARRRSQALHQQGREEVRQAEAIATRLAQLRQEPAATQPTAAERMRALADRVRARTAVQ